MRHMRLDEIAVVMGVRLGCVRNATSDVNERETQKNGEKSELEDFDYQNFHF